MIGEVTTERRRVPTVLPRRATLLVDRWVASRGGQEGYLFALTGALVRRGVGVRVLCREGTDTRPGISVEALVPPGGGASGERRFLAAAALGVEAGAGPVLAPRLVAFATHVQLHGGLFADALEAERESMEGARRDLFGLGTAFNGRRRLLLRCERQVLPGACPQIMVWTEAQRGRLRELGVRDEGIRVAPPGVDLGLFSPDPNGLRPGGCAEFLFLAHNPRLKGLRAALGAIAVARRRGLPARLTVAGRGSSGAWRRLAARLGIAHAVSFEGPLSPRDVVRRPRAAIGLLHPTFLDPCSLACLEAAACGVPVITTRRNGAVERLGPAGAALVVDDPRDVEGIARAIEEIANPTRRAELREAALGFRPSLDAQRHLDDVIDWLGVG
jgi:UDP-glucose:(heptosyl)LPS alpha-1,3-glucosyltransferase